MIMLQQHEPLMILSLKIPDLYIDSYRPENRLYFVQKAEIRNGRLPFLKALSLILRIL